ncbi:hypothetical protein [Marilutibacter chinensis]|nr:hypothetical protein [Lysobacter chinensis]
MKRAALLCAALLCASTAMARNKMTPLSEDDAALLQGKKVAVALHQRPSFGAMTAGKASFGLIGAGAMYAAGNKLVDENNVADPATLIREQLASSLRTSFGAEVLNVDAEPTDAKKPRQIAATHPEADYVLDVRSTGWGYAYYPMDWNSYWVNYGVQVQLVETATARQVSNMACNASTRDHANRPSRDQMHANGAQLLKDVTAHLGWTCVQLLSREQFKLPEENIATIPGAYADPLALASSGTDAGERMTTAASVNAQSDSSTEVRHTPEGDDASPAPEDVTETAPEIIPDAMVPETGGTATSDAGSRQA